MRQVSGAAFQAKLLFSLFGFFGLSLSCGAEDPAMQGPEPVKPFVAPEPPPVGFQVKLQPVTIAAGDDIEFCAYFNLELKEDADAAGEPFLLKDLIATGIDPRAEEIAIGEIDVIGAAGLHHIQILALENDLEDVPDRHIFECAIDLFGGPLTGDVDPLFFTSLDDYKVKYPEGVARILRRVEHRTDPSRKRGTQLLYNFHYVNPTTEPITAEVVVNLHAVPRESVQHSVRSAWWNYMYFKVPAMTQTVLDAHGSFLVDVNLVGMTSHQHQYGKQFTYTLGGEEIYRSRYWNEPRYLPFPSGRPLAAGEQVAFRCEWDNTSQGNRFFGLRAEDEMCTAIIEYYAVDEAQAEALLVEQRRRAEEETGGSPNPFEGSLISLERFLGFPEEILQQITLDPDNALMYLDQEILCGIGFNLREMEEQYGASPEVFSLQGLLEFLKPICRL